MVPKFAKSIKKIEKLDGPYEQFPCKTGNKNMGKK